MPSILGSIKIRIVILREKFLKSHEFHSTINWKEDLHEIRE